MRKHGRERSSERAMHANTPPIGKYRLGELVKKIETSRTQFRKRVKKLQKRLRTATKEHRRIAKVKNLRAVSLTLNYDQASAFCKQDVSKFISALRMKLRRQGHTLPYVWVLEQAPLNLHFHLMLWLPRGFSLGFAELSRLWKCGSTWVASTQVVKAWCKYISKCETKENLPVGARMYGVGGLDAEGKNSVARSALPRWLLALISSIAVPRRCCGGWVLHETGEFFSSPFEWTPWGIRLKQVDVEPAC